MRTFATIISFLLIARPGAGRAGEQRPALRQAVGPAAAACTAGVADLDRRRHDDRHRRLAASTSAIPTSSGKLAPAPRSWAAARPRAATATGSPARPRARRSRARTARTSPASPPRPPTTPSASPASRPARRSSPVKVLDEDGGSFEDIAAGVRWSVDNGADVINLSLGALPGVQALVITGMITDLQEAIAYARANGVVVVAAAGNDFASICGSPGFDAGALCVASTDKREARSSFSNFAFNPSLDAVSGARRLAGADLRRGHRLDRPASATGSEHGVRLRHGLRRDGRHVDGVAARRRRRRRCSPPRAATTSAIVDVAEGDRAQARHRPARRLRPELRLRHRRRGRCGRRPVARTLRPAEVSPRG